MPTSHRHTARSRALARRAAVVLLMLGMIVPAGACAQKADSARVAARPRPAAPRDSARPPLSARRAFVYSLILPGYSQSVLGRNKTAAILLFVEAMSIAMIRQSDAEVREARRFGGDSVVITYVDPNTGLASTTLAPRRFDSLYVKTRRSHEEDWIALLIANHLFAGADAFVAANLWDVPTQFSIRLSRGTASVGAKLSW